MGSVGGIVGPGRIAARANGVFVMEAMWTRFQPVIVRARELIADGAILDLGVYVVSFTQMLLGTPTSVTARDRWRRAVSTRRPGSCSATTTAAPAR